MKKNSSSVLIVFVCLLHLSISCQNIKKEGTKATTKNEPQSSQSFDSLAIATFFKKHPAFQKYQKEVATLYQQQEYNFIWFDSKGVKEIGYLLYNKASHLTLEGIYTNLPYQKQLDAIFQEESNDSSPNTESELLISCMYMYYSAKVFTGLPVEKRTELGWYLPRKKLSVITYLDSILVNPSLINEDEKEISGQYYRLREQLKKYRALEQKEWGPIVVDLKKTYIKIGDSIPEIAIIRNRMYLLGDLDSDSKSNVYDANLAEGINRYINRNGLTPTTSLSKQLLSHLNISIANRMKTIIVNMERWRWFASPIAKDKRFVFINIPAYQLRYFENGKPLLESKVVVGKSVHKTVVFSAPMKYIVFNPYWNVPTSIVKKEILPAIEKNSNYLSLHNMEWNKGGIRQKPGPKNALGKVKFIFPNSNAIYLHDTPSKSLFDQEKRDFSHGCIRLEKPKELAQLILKNDPHWTHEKIEKAMNSSIEKWYTLPQPIPVYIGYFTAWVTKEGNIHFYDNVYQRDDRLARLLLEE
jgi:murein L,D-transpeptidase YcbB/YkuD